MKCNEPYPQGSYEECRLDLGHTGDHEYFDKKWSRPEPADPDPAVEALLDQAAREARVWGVGERKFPVVIERTLTYVLWVDADCEDNALLNAADDSWETDLSKETPTNGSDEVRRLDEFERQDAFESEMGREFGPQIQCPGCRRLSFRREWFHDPYRKCHGPIAWRQPFKSVLPWREHNATPVYGGARTAVVA
ncbi:hypothetical protein ACFC5H_09080 [Streptomyces rochei]|uniref:hypothetical protein n=1 Tax=Actinomycetes TaxID=1760 RepID=UPI0035DFBB66